MQGGQGEDAAAQPLADHQHVRDDVEILAGEHAAGPAQGVGDLVEDEQRPVAVAGLRG